MQNSSTDNVTPGQGKGQESSTQPHPRDGHLRIPNEVAEALARVRVSGSQAQILWAVLRKTLGWQHSGEWRNEPYPISLTALNQATGVSRSSCLRDIKNLTRRHILSRQQRRGKAPLLSLNLDIGRWGSSKIGTSSKIGNGGVAKLTPVLVAELTPPIDTKSYLPKETLNKPKEDGAPTTDELKALGILRQLKGWRYDEADDLAWLRDFTKEFSDFNLPKLRAARDYYSGWPSPKHKGGWKNRFRNWMQKEPEFKRSKEHPGPRGKSFEQWRKEQQEEVS